MPLITVPASRKVVATFVVAGVLALLRTVGVIEPPADLTAWIIAGAGLFAGAAVGEGSKYVNFFLEARKLPFRVEDEA